MKHLLVALMLSLLILFSGASALGAIHDSNGDYYTFSNPISTAIFSMALDWGSDTWFSVLPIEPEISAGFLGDSLDSGESESIFALDYFQNDFIFAELGVWLLDDGTLDTTSTNLCGSYLFDFGLFLGLNYFNISNGEDASGYIFSPGYAFKFDEQSYIALSLDYASIEDGHDVNDIIGYELDAKYIDDTVKFFAQYYSPTDEYSDGDIDPCYNLGACFLVSEPVTIGIDLLGSYGNTFVVAGLTWINDLIIFDAAFGFASDEDEDTSYYNLSTIFKFAKNFGAGLEYLSEEDIDDAQIIVKFRYMVDESEFSLNYGLENDSYPTMYNLVYEQKL